MRKLTVVFVAALAASSLSCNRAAPETTDKPKVALVLKTLNHPFFVDMRRGAQEAADRLGVQLEVQAAEHTETFVGSDNYEGGKLAGAHVLKVTGGKARVGILEGIPGHETGDSRLRGFRDAVKDAPGITVVASQPANWERDQGFNVFQNMLQAHPEIDTVFAASDLMALGAVEAIAAAGKTGKIKVIGFDALEDAKKAIAEGKMSASVAQFPYEMGKAAVESAVKVLAG